MTDDQIKKLAFQCFWECDVKNGVSTNFPRVVTPMIIEDAIRTALKSSAPTEVVPHMADAPPVSRERIVQGHSFFPPSAAFPKGYATGHRPYSQGWTDASGKSSEACYICTCLAEIDRLERELAARSPQQDKT